MIGNFTLLGLVFFSPLVQYNNIRIAPEGGFKRTIALCILHPTYCVLVKAERGVKYQVSLAGL